MCDLILKVGVSSKSRTICGGFLKFRTFCIGQCIGKGFKFGHLVRTGNCQHFELAKLYKHKIRRWEKSREEQYLVNFLSVSGSYSYDTINDTKNLLMTVVRVLLIHFSIDRVERVYPVGFYKKL